MAMVGSLIVPVLIGLGVFFLSKFIGKRFKFSGKMCLLFAALSFAAALIAQSFILPANIPKTPLSTKDEPKLATIRSGEIFLSGPGTYLISPEKISGPDNIITKISGLSKDDIVTLKTVLNVGEIVIEESVFIKMQSPIFCLRSTDDRITFTCIGNNVCVEDSRINIANGC
jgi:hypothetical protein